jgi:hypothetical protein
MTRGPADESNLEGFLTRIPLFAEVDRVALARLAAHLDPVVLTGARLRGAARWTAALLALTAQGPFLSMSGTWHLAVARRCPEDRGP